MTDSTDLSRRMMLALGGSGVALTLAACTAPLPDSSGSGATPNEAAPSGSPPSTPDDAPAGTPTDTPAALARLADIPVGGSISATLAGAPILISQPEAGTVVAFSAICTHQGCVVAPGEGEFACPCHSSRFNLSSGEVRGGPAQRPLEKVPVAVDGDSVVAG